jgi:hypothetical protein
MKKVDALMACADADVAIAALIAVSRLTGECVCYRVAVWQTIDSQSISFVYLEVAGQGGDTEFQRSRSRDCPDTGYQ